jgi:hypothetical protein
MFEIILVLNALWFLMGFNVFSIRSEIFAKILVKEESRDTPVFAVLTASGQFLGGFNLAFAVLNILLVCNLEVFADVQQRSILLFVFAVAHGSQFFPNLPIALRNRKGEGVWQVLKGTMLFIFITDFVMMALNLGMIFVLH